MVQRRTQFRENVSVVFVIRTCIRRPKDRQSGQLIQVAVGDVRHDHVGVGDGAGVSVASGVSLSAQVFHLPGRFFFGRLCLYCFVYFGPLHDNTTGSEAIQDYMYCPR